MEKIIYLGGAMTHMTVDEYTEWRNVLQNRFYDINHQYKCFNPAKHFAFEDIENGVITDQQAMEIDLYHLRRSDLMIVNFFKYPNSLGTMAEMAIAHENNIPILGLNNDGFTLHPWQTAFVNKCFSNMDDLVQFAVEQYLDMH